MKDADAVVGGGRGAAALVDASEEGIEHAAFGSDVEAIGDEATKVPAAASGGGIEPTDAGHEDQRLTTAPGQRGAVVVEVVNGLKVDVELDGS